MTYAAVHLADAVDMDHVLAAEQVQDVRFHLIYIDPPYQVGRAHRARLQRGLRGEGELAYVDAWGSVEGLLRMLEPRLVAVHRWLAETGTLVVHMDQRGVHDAKVLLDRLLGRGSFRGEIIWSMGNGAKGRGVPATHQTLLLYAKHARARSLWNDQDPDLREPYADTSQRMHFQKTDADGRRFRERVVQSKNGPKTYRYYADAGRKRGSVWTDIPSMVANTPIGAEATGYPTQKPVRLLERLVRATTLEGQWVLDPMCGSGTTLVAATKLGRHAVGLDTSPLAVRIANERLLATARSTE